MYFGPQNIMKKIATVITNFSLGRTMRYSYKFSLFESFIKLIFVQLWEYKNYSTEHFKYTCQFILSHTIKSNILSYLVISQ